MSHHLLDYPALLRREGFRLTPQRQIILDAICHAEKHISTEEIIHAVQATSPWLNRATIYRNLIFLRDRHLVVSADIGGETVFEIAQLTPHHHLVCRQCGAEENLAHEYVARLYDDIRRRQGFQAETDHLTLTGLCHACRQAKPKKAIHKKSGVAK
jgi:Fur family transcriptional regulator, ferric uptake regulator